MYVFIFIDTCIFSCVFLHVYEYTCIYLLWAGFFCDALESLCTCKYTNVNTNIFICIIVWIYKLIHTFKMNFGWHSRTGLAALQHTATHGNALQHTAILCNPLQHSATHTATHTASHCNTHCHTLQHTATHCNTLQHTATHCNTLQYTLQHTATHTATHCISLQHRIFSWHSRTSLASVILIIMTLF